MVSTIKSFVYLHEIPFEMEKQAKAGYVHFKIDFLDVRKPRRERVVLRYWKDSHPAKNKECPDCGEKFNNRMNLMAHMDKERRAPTMPTAIKR